MKRYLIMGNAPEGEGAKRRKEVAEGTRPSNYDPRGHKVILLCEFEDDEKDFMILIETDDIDDALADLEGWPLTIKPLKLCPADCTYCPPTMVIEPLRES